MKQKYRHGTTKYISLGERFRSRFKLLILLILALVAGAVVFLYDVYTKNQSPPTPVSKTTVKNVTFDSEFFSTPYFRFTDSGKWKFIQNQSTSSKFVFQKFLSNSELVQHQLIVYVNTTPIPLELATSRVLPVSLNDSSNGFKPTNVSDHCGKTYKNGELHKVQPRQIDGVTLLCDPEQGQFRVVIARSGGDYNMRLKRSDGSFANYIIIYQNQKLDPDPETVMQIASSFQSI